MQVGLVVFRALVVDDVRDVVHVQSAGRDVSRHQHVDLAVAERAHGPLALALAQVAVHRRRREAPGRQGLGHLVCGPLGPAEHHAQPAPVGLQDPGQHLDLVHLVRAEHVLHGQRDQVRLVAMLGADVQRLAQVPPGQLDHVARHGGREQHGLPGGRGELQDPLDVGQEPEVQHLVRLVQDQGAQPGQVQVPLPGQVEQPAGSADHDVHRGEQGVDLGLVGAAAVDGHDSCAPEPAGHAQVLGDLAREFAGRHHDQGHGRGRLGGRCLRHLLQQRDAERERLAGAGAGLADDVVPAQPDGQGQALDGERRGDAGDLQGRTDLLINAKVTERLRYVRRTCCRIVVGRRFCYGRGQCGCQLNQLPSVARCLGTP